MFCRDYRGRDPALRLLRDGSQIRQREWALHVFDVMQPVAEKLDAAHGSHDYTNALQHHHQLLVNPELTPSTTILAEMETHNESFT